MLRISSLALLLLLTPPAAADPAGDLLAGVQSWIDGTRDLKGKFDQELLSGAFGTGIEESGDWFLRRPGQLRFDYKRPETKVALVNGDETLLWVEEDEHTVRGRLDSGNGLLMTLLAGERPLADLFVPSIDVAPVARGRARLRLVPHSGDEAFTEVILTVPDDGAGLHAVEVLDAAGNRTFYRFPGMRRNTGLPDEIFLFEPPETGSGR
jgi:outer membrane lipoprotein carrier protein